MKFMLIVWAAFLARVKPGLHHREAGLHEHDEEAGEQRPDEVDGDLVVTDSVHHFGNGRILRILDGDVLGRAGHRTGRIALPDRALRVRRGPPRGQTHDTRE